MDDRRELGCGERIMIIKTRGRRRARLLPGPVCNSECVGDGWS